DGPVHFGLSLLITELNHARRPCKDSAGASRTMSSISLRIAARSAQYLVGGRPLTNFSVAIDFSAASDLTLSTIRLASNSVSGKRASGVKSITEVCVRSSVVSDGRANSGQIVYGWTIAVSVHFVGGPSLGSRAILRPALFSSSILRLTDSIR